MTQVEQSSETESEVQEAPKMKSASYYKSLSIDKQLKMLKEAKGGTWYDGWKPYCLRCRGLIRMDSKEYGFRCSRCTNQIGFDLIRLLESPLNKTM